MTVLELKEALKDVDDGLEVVIDLGDTIAIAESAAARIWSTNSKRTFEILAIIEN